MSDYLCGINEGYYEIVRIYRTNDADWGPCTGTVISDGTNPPVTIYQYDLHPKRVSLHSDIEEQPIVDNTRQEPEGLAPNELITDFEPTGLELEHPAPAPTAGELGMVETEE